MENDRLGRNLGWWASRPPIRMATETVANPVYDRDGRSPMILESQLTLPPAFKGFNPRGAMRIYYRNLPHWRQPGATYFLTFRLADSIPASVMEEMEAERLLWIRNLNDANAKVGGEISETLWEDYQAFLVRTMRRYESVMDACHGSCLLKHSVAREIVSNALLHFNGDRCEVHGFVVMPNHVHVAVRPLSDWQPEHLLHSWKSFTVHEINKRLGQSGDLWQDDTWDRIVRDAGHWFRVMRYLLRNPSRAKLLQGESTTWVWERLVDRNASRVMEEGIVEEPW